MSQVANIFIFLIAILHAYILVLEMFLWTKPAGLRAFGQSLEKAKSSAILAANQGLYNGFLSAGLFWGLFQGDSEFAWQLKVFFLACVLIAGLYGGYSVNKKIALIQALPAAVALVMMLL